MTNHTYSHELWFERTYADGDALTATGHFAVKQTEYGIKPVSVGGVVSVKDAVDVSFTIAGR